MTNYIVDTYSKFARNKNVKAVYRVYDYDFCIREVEVEYDWGKPRYDFSERDESDPRDYLLYENEKDAMAYLRHLGGVRVK